MSEYEDWYQRHKLAGELEMRRGDQDRYLKQNTPHTRNLAKVNARYIRDLEREQEESQ